MNDTNGLVQKLWNYCNVLRDDGLSYGDYVEQLEAYYILHGIGTPDADSPIHVADSLASTPKVEAER